METEGRVGGVGGVEVGKEAGVREGGRGLQCRLVAVC